MAIKLGMNGKMYYLGSGVRASWGTADADGIHGGAAPGSWESLGTDSRPFTPGALAGDDQPLQELPGGPMSPVPGAPDFRMPPQDSQGPGVPMLQPPPIEGEVPPMNDSTAPKILEPAPVPPAGDDITGFTPLPDGFLDVPSTSNRDNAGRTRF